MKSKEVVRTIMQRKGVTNIEMANKLGLSRSAMWDRLNSTRKADLSVSVLTGMLDLLGYKLVIMPKEVEKPDESYSVE